MPTTQRTKTGCWTCRLRRKKCQEGGPPCANCETRGIKCHGYGPKPAWKDRGGMEREEASRLHLQTRPRRAKRKGSFFRPISVLPTHLPTAPAASLALSNSGAVEFPILPICSGVELSFLDPLDITTLGASIHTQRPLFSPTTDDLTPCPLVPEERVQLIIHFLDHVFPVQYRFSNPFSSICTSWLLYPLACNPAFYNASLSMAAYTIFLRSIDQCEVRWDMFEDYQKCRSMAVNQFGNMTPAPGHPSATASHAAERLVSAVQIALLEALGRNMQSCLSYFAIAAERLVETQALIWTQERNFVLNTPTCSALESPSPLGVFSPLPDLGLPPMALHAVQFFSILALWNDILSSSASRRVTPAASTYRQLLGNDSFARVFYSVTECEVWLLTAILDATALEVWKENQRILGRLSIHELVDRVQIQESRAEAEIQRLGELLGNSIEVAEAGEQRNTERSIRTNIFAHALLLQLQNMLPRSLPAAPDIQCSVLRSIAAWNLWSPSLSLDWLSWAYCTTASLAKGGQRDIFQNMLAQAAELGPARGTLLDLQRIVAECWTEADTLCIGLQNDIVYWKDVLQKTNQCILFM
ncbi:hypothetical protein GQ53DRAFT_874427 [Thozetella sp. PMI_491]|nr:hypothetical protein GQ53DRAFT_874427 [Thozetella sp. PMI_491]